MSKRAIWIAGLIVLLVLTVGVFGYVNITGHAVDRGAYDAWQAKINTPIPVPDEPFVILNDEAPNLNYPMPEFRSPVTWSGEDFSSRIKDLLYLQTYELPNSLKISASFVLSERMKQKIDELSGENAVKVLPYASANERALQSLARYSSSETGESIEGGNPGLLKALIAAGAVKTGQMLKSNPAQIAVTMEKGYSATASALSKLKGYVSPRNQVAVDLDSATDAVAQGEVVDPDVLLAQQVARQAEFKEKYFGPIGTSTPEVIPAPVQSRVVESAIKSPVDSKLTDFGVKLSNTARSSQTSDTRLRATLAELKIQLEGNAKYNPSDAAEIQAEIDKITAELSKRGSQQGTASVKSSVQRTLDDFITEPSSSKVAMPAVESTNYADDMSHIVDELAVLFKARELGNINELEYQEGLLRIERKVHETTQLRIAQAEAAGKASHQATQQASVAKASALAGDTSGAQKAASAATTSSERASSIQSKLDDFAPSSDDSIKVVAGKAVTEAEEVKAVATAGTKAEDIVAPANSVDDVAKGMAVVGAPQVSRLSTAISVMGRVLEVGGIVMGIAEGIKNGVETWHGYRHMISAAEYSASTAGYCPSTSEIGHEPKRPFIVSTDDPDRIDWDNDEIPDELEQLSPEAFTCLNTIDWNGLERDTYIDAYGKAAGEFVADKDIDIDSDGDYLPDKLEIDGSTTSTKKVTYWKFYSGLAKPAQAWKETMHEENNWICSDLECDSGNKCYTTSEGRKNFAGWFVDSGKYKHFIPVYGAYYTVTHDLLTQEGRAEIGQFAEGAAREFYDRFVPGGKYSLHCQYLDWCNEIDEEDDIVNAACYCPSFALTITNPCNPDTDDDGVSDLKEIDYENDPTVWQKVSSVNEEDESEQNAYSKDNVFSQYNLQENIIADKDQDGLMDDFEVEVYGTQPGLYDTDEDGLSDFNEVWSAYGGARYHLFPGQLADCLQVAEIHPEYFDLVTYANPGEPVSLGSTYEVGELYYKGCRTNPAQADSDFDGISDYDEVYVTEVSPWITSPNKADTDEDGLTDAEEIFTSTLIYDGGASTQDTRELARMTSNFNKISATYASAMDIYKINGEEISRKEYFASNPLNPDSDEDGLLDGEEIELGTSPMLIDSDGDGISDFNELRGNKIATDPTTPDTDQDGLSDSVEYNYYWNRAKSGTLEGFDETSYEMWFQGTADTNDFCPNGLGPLCDDSDEDRIKDGDEIMLYTTDPSNADTDGDGISDSEEINTQKEYMFQVGSYSCIRQKYVTQGYYEEEKETEVNEENKVELFDSGAFDPTQNGLNPLQPDTDFDGVLDGKEMEYETNPCAMDTDLDLLSDSFEVFGPEGYSGEEFYSDPTNANGDEDLLLDGQEYLFSFEESTLIDCGNGRETSKELFSEYLLSKGLTVVLEDMILDSTTEDTDQDEIDDFTELCVGSIIGGETIYTDPTNPDSDADGLLDGTELQGDLITDPFNRDTDGDFLNDSEEIRINSNPLVKDSDEDGVWDGIEYLAKSDTSNKDSDSDGLEDFEEIFYGSEVTKESFESWIETVEAEQREDSLKQIISAGLDPNKEDTDSDSLLDGQEITFGLDPKADDKNIDTDSDGLFNIDEIQFSETCDYTFNARVADLEYYYMTQEIICEELYDYGDKDFLPNKWELENLLLITSNDTYLDPDNDLLKNIDEFWLADKCEYAFDPLESDYITFLKQFDTFEKSEEICTELSDYDEDGFPDWWEVKYYGEV